MTNKYSVLLRNDVTVPLLGFGTSHNGGYNKEAIHHALASVGYRLIDTAQRYGCEEQLGNDIRESGVDRADIFIINKIWMDNYGFEACMNSVEVSLRKMGVCYFDLLLLHWPGAEQSVINDTWKALELLLSKGKTRSIGVSNFQERHLNRLLEYATHIPHVNQVELHPYQNDVNLIKYCQTLGIQVCGYSPLGKGALLNDESVLALANEINVTPAQILIRWSVQKGIVTIPKSTNNNRIEENFQVWHFELSKSAMFILDRLHRNARVTWDPSKVP